MDEILEPKHFFDLDGHRFAELFAGVEIVWQALDQLPDFVGDNLHPNVAQLRRGNDVLARTVVLWRGEVIDEGFTVELGDIKRGGLEVRRGGEILAGATLVQAGAILADDEIELGKGTLVEAGALIKGPTIIGDRTEVRHGAYLRGKLLIGDSCVVGHATEMKASIMMGGSQAGHFAYLGDSILGQVNLGAGTKLANLKVFPGNVTITVLGTKHDTGRRKVGAILADAVELGCNSVTTPGTVMGRGALAYPNVTVRGFHPAETIIKSTTGETTSRAARD